MHFDMPGMERLHAELSAEMGSSGFWEEPMRAQEVAQKVKSLEGRMGRYHRIVGRIDDLEIMVELANEEGDTGVVNEIVEEEKAISGAIEETRLSTLLTGKYDANNAILSLHAGAGGTEAQDWTQMLYRMYTRYCEKKGFDVRILEYLDGDEAGTKSVSFLVTGDNAYGYMKAEKGVHRLVRISPFDSSARRHTSFSSLDVMPEIDDSIEITINSDDLKVDTYRASGAGGQHVNKTESAIRITHIPTGVVVACQTERSQIQNRETAMRMLRSKLAEIKEQEMIDEALAIKGEMKKIEWGSQIRSYVFQPYTMVKDHRTGTETSNITGVMDGELDPFIWEYLKKL